MRANFSRTDRIAALLRREIGALVHDAVREKLIPSVSVSDVEVTRDLAHATVFVTALRAEQGRPAVKELNEAAWEFRRELSQRVQLRAVPALHFRYDDSVDRGERIEHLLRAPIVATPEPVAKPASKARAPRKVAIEVTTTAAPTTPTAPTTPRQSAVKTAAVKKAAAKKAPVKKAAAKKAAPAGKRAARKPTD